METQKEGAIAVRYDLDYEGVKEIFDDMIKFQRNVTGENAQNGWLPNFDESILEEGERLNILLPLMQ